VGLGIQDDVDINSEYKFLNQKYVRDIVILCYDNDRTPKEGDEILQGDTTQDRP
jgi:hypothetical protein